MNIFEVPPNYNNVLSVPIEGEVPIYELILRHDEV
jgi:hypothetical protein